MMLKDDITKLLSSRGIKFEVKKVSYYEKSGSRVNVPKSWGECEIIIVKPDAGMNISEKVDAILEEVDEAKKGCAKLILNHDVLKFKCNEAMDMTNPSCIKCIFGMKIIKLRKMFTEQLESKDVDKNIETLILKDFDIFEGMG